MSYFTDLYFLENHSIDAKYAQAFPLQPAPHVWVDVLLVVLVDDHDDDQLEVISLVFLVERQWLPHFSCSNYSSIIQIY